jgi:hypothetical protein
MMKNTGTAELLYVELSSGEKKNWLCDWWYSLPVQITYVFFLI